MAGAHRYRRRSEMAVSTWLSTGATAVGIGAALISGGATAAAQPGDATHHAAGDTSPHRSPTAASATASPRHAKPAPKKHNRSPSPDLAKKSDQHTVANRAAATRPTDLTAPAANTSKLAEITSAGPTPTTPAAQESGSGTVPTSISQAAVISKVGRHARSATITAAPDDSPYGSAPLAALATVTQLASAPVDNGTRTAAAAATTNNWLVNKVAAPGTSVATAIQEIGQAQKAAGNNPLSQMCLSAAKWALTAWQQTNSAAIAHYANNQAGMAGFVAKAVLDFNEALPGFARDALHGALAFTLYGSAAHTLTGQATKDGRVYGAVKLSMYNGTEPIIEVSINGGPKVKVLVDTGSSGLVIAGSSVGTAAGLGPKIGSGTSGYTGGLTYGFDIYNTTVNFGNGITTTPTAVDIVNGTSQAAYLKYMATNGVVGVLGIGTNSAGPGPSLIASALPGELKDGIFINEAAGKLQFGPNPRPVRATVSGSPITAGVVKVLGVSYPVDLVIDSGGVYGTMPSTVWTAVGETQVPGGIPIEVYSADGSTLLYSYTTTNTNTPLITFDAAHSHQMNTGYTPFNLGPVYISYTTANGETNFDI